MTIWIKVSADKYEFIEEMGDSVAILARKLHMNPQSIMRAVWKEKKTGKWTPYKKVVIDEVDT